MLIQTQSGLYCPAADVYIDPHKPVNKALITHAHADHARPNHKHYLAAQGNEHILKLRLGQNISLQTLPFSQPININGVNISFHPAGHIPGSAQIRLENQGEIWVVSGDYKLNNDGISTPFEPVKCHHFITESTFGLPVFRWTPQADIFNDIREYFHNNDENLIISAYSLGKAQRLIHHLQDLPLYVTKTIADTTQALNRDGFNIFLPPIYPTTKNQRPTTKHILITSNPTDPQNSTPDTQNLIISCSGWMALRGSRRWGNFDRGFVLSDHADFQELETACLVTDAHTISVTHGYSAVFARYLSEKHGLETKVLKSAWERME
jgi:putative mRNA 3-end processing factor